MNEDCIYLIDAFSLIYRAHYGNVRIKNGAAITMARMLLSILAKYNPKHIACVFDLPETTFRHKLYSEYKSNRTEMPICLREQIPMIRNLVSALNIPTVELAGYEADDVIGTLAHAASKKGMSSIIISPDKDLLQIVDDQAKIKVLNNRNGDVWIDRLGVKERLGVWPEQVVDMLTLTGDASDNIKGVDGIGDKGAQELIALYGTLENILAHRHELKRKAHRDGLETSLARLPIIKLLVTVVTDITLPITLDDLVYNGIDQAKARSIFKQYGFDALVKDFTTISSLAKSSSNISRKYTAAINATDLAMAASACRKMGVFSLDTETTSIDPTRGHLVGIGLSWKKNEGIYIPIAHLKPDSEGYTNGLPGLYENSCLPTSLLDLRMEPEEFFDHISPYLDHRNIPFYDVLKILGPLFIDSNVLKVGQNLKYDLQVLKRHNLKVNGIANDSMVLSFLLNSELHHNLDDLSSRHLNIRPIPFEELVGKGKEQKRFDEVDFDYAIQYAAEDADLALQLCQKLEPLVNDSHIDALYKKVDLPLVEVLAELELTGVRLDVAVLDRLAITMRIQRDIAEKKAIELAGEPFNLNSPSQLGRILYEKIKLPILKRTSKTKAPATDESILLRLALEENGEIASVILRHRQIQKLLSTYVEALPTMVNPITGRLHTKLHQAVVGSGRLASSHPNLQNIPIRTDEGRAIRAAFVPEPGWTLLDADYSQIELRVVASLAQDPILLEAFKCGEDIHKRTASEVMGIPIEEVSPTQRSAAKTVNFGLLYGQGAITLAHNLNISFKEAKKFIERYFERMPKVAEWIETTKAQAIQEGLVRTFWGRVRRIPNLHSSDQLLKTAALREAVNTVIQGTAADIMRRAMVRLHSALVDKGLRSRLLLQVHDELLVESPPEEVKTMSSLLIAVMQEADDIAALDVKLVANVRIGNNWLECK
jgi:DNA polymerase-1